jgi:hypothetical protein
MFNAALYRYPPLCLKPCTGYRLCDSIRDEGIDREVELMQYPRRMNRTWNRGPGVCRCVSYSGWACCVRMYGTICLCIDGVDLKRFACDLPLAFSFSGLVSLYEATFSGARF